MDDTVDVNFDIVDLGCSLLLHKTREQFLEASAYGHDDEDEPLSKAAELWGKWGEDLYHGFLLLNEGISMLNEAIKDNGDDEADQWTSTEANGRASDEEEIDRELIDGTKALITSHQERTSSYGSAMCCSHKQGGSYRKNTNSYAGFSMKNKSTERVETGEEIEMSIRNQATKTPNNTVRRQREFEGSVDGLDFFHEGFRVTMCTPERDLTTEEEDEDPRQIKSNHTVSEVAQTESNAAEPLASNLKSIPQARFLQAKLKFQEAESFLKSLPPENTSVDVSLSKSIRRARLVLSCAMMRYLDSPHLAVTDCKDCVSRLNSLELVKWVFAKRLESPNGLRPRVARKMNSSKWRKVLEKVHFINYIVWKWLMLTQGKLATGEELGIPFISTEIGDIHPTDDWRLRDKCQTCVEFERRTPYSCTMVVNSKDQILVIDARNEVTTFSSDGKPLSSFSVSTVRHPHTRWMIGIDQEDRIYIGSLLGIGSEPSRPLSIFSLQGELISEPELSGYWGQYHLYAVNRKGIILCLTAGTQLGNRISVYESSGKHITSFPAHEIEYPRHLASGRNGNIIVSGTSSMQSDDLAFQTFDETGQQLFYFKPEVEFQRCAVDPLSGNILVVGIHLLYDYRYLLCDTVILTGELNIFGLDGQIVQSKVKLRWPFRVISGLAVLRSGLVAMVTVDEPYCAIHII